MLSPSQQKARAGKLTASRISVLMTGNAEGIHRLWRQMALDEPEPDLNHIWAIRLGEATENLNLCWAERKLGEQIIDRGVFVQHPSFEWAGSTIDGMLRETERLIEAKHVGGREPLETIIDRYQPQLQWQMECAGWKPNECALSVIFGANEPVIEWIQRDDEYAAEMVRRGQQFMQHVRNRSPPVEMPPVPPPVVPVKRYDMAGNNAWSANAATWITTRQAAKDNAAADKELKALVPADAKECSGYGLTAKRDRAGRISLRSENHERNR